VYLRQWALKRWDEGTFVDLRAELPGLKAEIKEMRENWAAGINDEEEDREAEAEAKANA
jgi:G2/mitotic-specific cyclin 2